VLRTYQHSGRIRIKFQGVDIQGDSGRKLNILTSDIMGDCEENDKVNACLFLSGYLSRAVSIYT
jgi:hypothetical protein